MSNKQKNAPDQTITLSVTDLNNLGCGVGRTDQGMVVFVKGAVTGDVVEAQIIKRTSSYLVGRLTRIVEASPFRTGDDLCTAPEACGGCVYRHVTYAHELECKHNRVVQAFRKAGLPHVEVLPVKHTNPEATGYGYRNKGMFPVRNGKNGMEAGFFAAKSHKLIPCRACTLQPVVFSDIVCFICEYCTKAAIPAYCEEDGHGVLRHIYLRTSHDGQVMVCLVVNTATPPKALTDHLTQALVKAFPCVVSVLYNVNTKDTNVVLGEDFVCLYGNPYIEDTLCGKQFRLSPDSFYQVNHDAAELLYGLAMESAELDGTQHLLDLYCGAGTIGLSMSDKVSRLTGIEIVPKAVACAKENAALNGISPDRAHFFCADASDAESLLTSAEAEDAPPVDVAVIDPPRKGTTPELIDALCRRNIPRIVYVSCEPETLARDCALFEKQGYTIGPVQPVDLFPRTGHVENVVCLKKESP